MLYNYTTKHNADYTFVLYIDHNNIIKESINEEF